MNTSLLATSHFFTSHKLRLKKILSSLLLLLPLLLLSLSWLVFLIYTFPNMIVSCISSIHSFDRPKSDRSQLESCAIAKLKQHHFD